MTDGPTGIQVAPITEDDMSKVQAILKRGMDAIIGMSQLAADVDMLRQTVAGLQAESERLRNQNNALDEALNHSREMRDNQARELAETKDKLAQSQREWQYAYNENTALHSELDDLDQQLVSAKHDANQWADEADKLQKALDTANASLASIYFAAHETIFGKAPEAMPQVEPKPFTPGASPPVQAITDTPHWPSEPSPVAEPQRPDGGAFPVEETSPDWKPGYSWDHTRQLYVKSV